MAEEKFRMVKRLAKEKRLKTDMASKQRAAAAVTDLAAAQKQRQRDRIFPPERIAAMRGPKNRGEAAE